MSAPGVSLREAAAALKVSRSKLLRFIREDGLPVIRKSERLFVDLTEARAWMALNDTGESVPKTAGALSPSDPRYHDRAMAAQLQHWQTMRAAGILRDRKAVISRCGEERAAFRQKYLALPQRLTVMASREENMKDLELGLAECLESLRAHILSTWDYDPVALDALPPVMPTVARDGDVRMLPLLSTADPRASYVAARTTKRELQLSKLMKDSIHILHAAHNSLAFYLFVKERLDEIPTRIEIVADDGMTGAEFLRVVSDELNSALEALSTADICREGFNPMEAGVRL